MYKHIGIFFLSIVILAISASPLFAVTAVPEIDPSMAPSAIALLTCGVLILKGKCRRK
jgi:uncharacterized membrane protein